ncbi:hypothetical protein ACHHV8_01695 [Paenibacillus sp. TAB 01]|uniref:hypothetical protein n=1 Tax=Paenibacillus sp. TAB 01 TaxID=3368988 RepID=UPI003751EE0B
MSCPDFIKQLLNENSENEWSEKDDLLEATGSPYDQKNQTDWWKQNCKIRATFKKIEREIKQLYKAEEKISVRLAGWTHIADLACCDRNTLKHPRRIQWTNKMRERLLKKIAQLNNSNTVNEHEESQLRDNDKIVLQNNLEKSRMEVARWVYKVKDLEHELVKYKRLANMRGRTVERLNSILAEKSKKIAEIETKLLMLKEKENETNLIQFPREESKHI